MRLEGNAGNSERLAFNSESRDLGKKKKKKKVCGTWYGSLRRTVLFLQLTIALVTTSRLLSTSFNHL